jgi:hypothetical protein
MDSESKAEPTPWDCPCHTNAIPASFGELSSWIPGDLATRFVRRRIARDLLFQAEADMAKSSETKANVHTISSDPGCLEFGLRLGDCPPPVDIGTGVRYL